MCPTSRVRRDPINVPMTFWSHRRFADPIIHSIRLGRSSEARIESPPMSDQAKALKPPPDRSHVRSTQRGIALPIPRQRRYLHLRDGALDDCSPEVCLRVSVGRSASAAGSSFNTAINDTAVIRNPASSHSTTCYSRPAREAKPGTDGLSSRRVASAACCVDLGQARCGDRGCYSLTCWVTRN
jgi:hypothetical protein